MGRDARNKILLGPGVGREPGVSEERTNRDSFFAAIGPLLRHGEHDRACPKCGSKDPKGKRFCPGREPTETRTTAKCYVLGGHLHAQCGCAFAWLERCADDEHELPGRGGLRYDEKMPEKGGDPIPKGVVADPWGVDRKE